MKRLVFFAHSYWELHWIYRVARELEIPIISDDLSVCETAKLLNLKTEEVNWAEWLNKNSYDGVITTNMHLGQNRDAVEKFFSSGKLAILMQHAWDSDLNILDKFWNHDMSRFTHYLVGSTQDYEWLKNKHGEKIIYTGMPHLDDLYEVKNEDDAESNQSCYFLSITPDSGIHGSRVEQIYFNLSNSYPVKYKIHPGGNYQLTKDSLLQTYPKLILLDDPKDDPKYTYRIIKNSSGIIGLESFLLIEASLMERPVIMHAWDQINQEIYNREENSRQKERLDPRMSSDISSPKYNTYQKDVAGKYLCDGQNTKRVVEYLYKLINE